MNTSIKNMSLSGGILAIIYLLSSCVYDSRVDARFKNCTNDTLFIGASHYDNLDSVEFLVNPNLLLSGKTQIP